VIFILRFFHSFFKIEKFHKRLNFVCCGVIFIFLFTFFLLEMLFLCWIWSLLKLTFISYDTVTILFLFLVVCSGISNNIASNFLDA
jgi:hypothetical protein